MMAEQHCIYPDRESVLVAYLYDDVDAVPGFGSVPLPTGVGFLLVSAGLLLRKGRGRPEMSLRLALGTLVLAALLPAVVFMASQARRAAEERLASFEREGRDLAGTLGAYVDKLIAERVGLITGLASSPALRSRDLEAFYQQARSVIDPAEGNVVIFDRSLKMLLNTGQPFGTELPGAVETNSAARAASRSYISRNAEAAPAASWPSSIRVQITAAVVLSRWSSCVAGQNTMPASSR